MIKIAIGYPFECWNRIAYKIQGSLFLHFFFMKEGYYKLTSLLLIWLAIFRNYFFAMIRNIMFINIILCNFICSVLHSPEAIKMKLLKMIQITLSKYNALIFLRCFNHIKRMQNTEKSKWFRFIKHIVVMSFLNHWDPLSILN